MDDTGKETSDGGEIYFHRNALDNVAFETLEVGMEVMFVEEHPDEGYPVKRVSIRKQQTPQET